MPVLTPTRRTVTAAGTAAVAVALAVGAAPQAFAVGGGGGISVTGGTSSLTVRPAFVAQLAKGTVTLAQVAPATKTTGTVNGKPVPVFNLPVSGGRVIVDTKSGFVRATGGLQFTAAGGTVTFTDFSVHLTQGVVMATVNGSVRKPVFTFDPAATRWTAGTGTLAISHVGLSLSKAGSLMLNQGLHVKAFAPDDRVGAVTVNATTS